MAYVNLELRHAPTDIFKSGNLDGCHIVGIPIASGARDPFDSHTDSFILRQGLAVGKVTASGYYQPVVRTQLSAIEAIGQTELLVDSTEGFAVGDNVEVETADGATTQDLGAITAIGASTITVTTALTAEYAVDSWLEVNDGRETALGLLAGDFRVTDTSGNDLDGINEDMIRITYNAIVNSGSVHNYDAKVGTDLADRIQFD